MTQRPADPASGQTYEVATRWFDAIGRGDAIAAFDCLADDVEWINYTPVPGYNDDMPWIGTYHGLEAVKKTFEIFLGVAQVKSERLVGMVVQGEEAACIIHEVSTVKQTGLDFEIEFIQWLTVRGGKIVRWKSYTDPSPIIRAIRRG